MAIQVLESFESDSAYQLVIQSNAAMRGVFDFGNSSTKAQEQFELIIHAV